MAGKTLPPKEQQAPNESLTLWGDVTDAILAKQFSKATTVKQELEEKQREKAREREQKSTPFVPVFFTEVTEKGGQPNLTEKGRIVLERAQKNDWSLEGVI